MIVVEVEILDEHKRFFAFVIYGMNLARDRRSLWYDLRSLFLVLSSSAWVLMGDFNVVRSLWERLVSLDAATAFDFN